MQLCLLAAACLAEAAEARPQEGGPYQRRTSAHHVHHATAHGERACEQHVGMAWQWATQGMRRHILLGQCTCGALASCPKLLTCPQSPSAGMQGRCNKVVGKLQHVWPPNCSDPVPQLHPYLLVHDSPCPLCWKSTARTQQASARSSSCTAAVWGTGVFGTPSSHPLPTHPTHGVGQSPQTDLQA